MLIEITSKGGPELKKLGASAKKLQQIFEHLDKAIEKAEMTTKEGKDAWRIFEKSLRGLITSVEKYHKAQIMLRKEMKKNNPNPALLEKYRTTMVSAKAAAHSYARTINKLVPGMVKLDFRTKNAGVNVKMLAKAQGIAKTRIDSFTSSVTKASREKKKNTSEVKKNTRATDQNTAATKKNEFATNQLRQRLDTTGSSTFAKLRRQVGAFRNQVLLLTFATVALRNAFKTAFDAANELEAAMKGLGAVAANTGNDMNKAMAAAQNLSDKGLLSVQDAAAGLKNLLSAGFGLKEAIGLMDTLTDSASFNRQGTLSLGQAVVGATQGIKNQNSIMVDNAGITKNLSIMYKEYAATIGTSAGKLDEAQKRQAIYNGVMKEGAIFAGDAEKVVLTMSGAITKLGVNSEKAAAQIGKLSQPLAGGFVQAFAQASDAMLKFGVALEENPEFMQRMVKIGYEVESTIRYLNASLGTFSQWLMKANEAMGGLIGAFIKGSAMLKLYNLRQNYTAKASATLTAENLKGHAVQELNNTGKKKEITLYSLADKQRWKSLSLRKRYRIELQRLRLNYEALNGSVARGTALMNLKSKALRTATFTAKGASVAMNLLKISIQGVKATLGPLLIAFLAFEAVLWIWKRLTELMTGVEKQSEVNKKRNDSLIASFKKSFQTIEDGYATSRANAMLFLDSQEKAIEMATIFNDVQMQYKKVMDARSQYAKAETRDQQAEWQIKIDQELEAYDKSLANLKAYQLEIEALTASHLSKLNAANVAYNEELETKQKRRGVDDIIEARQNLTARLNQYEEFLLSYTKLSKKDRESPEMSEKMMRMYTAVNMARDELEFQREKSLGNHYDRMIDIRQKYDMKLFEFNADEITRIKGQWASKRKVEEEKLKEHFDAMEALAKGAYESSKEDYISNVGMKIVQGADISSLDRRGAKYGQGAVGLIADDIREGSDIGANEAIKMADNVQAAYEKLIKVQANYKSELWDSNLTVDQTNQLVLQYKKSLIETKDALVAQAEALEAKSGEDTKAYANLINDIQGIEGLITVLNSAGKEYSVLKDEKASMDEQVKLGNQAYKEALDLLRQSMTIEEKRALGAAFYKEDLKVLSDEYKRLANAIRGVLDAEGNLTGAFARSILEAERAAAITNKYANSTQSLGGMIKEFINPMQTSDALMRKQAQATEQLAHKQKVAMDAHQDKLTLAGLELQAEKDTLSQALERGTYTNQEIKDQEKRISASQKKIDALLAEGKALEDLNEIEAKVLKDMQERERVQESIQRFTAYAEFFSNFTTQMQNLEHNRLMANMKYQKKLKKEVMDGVINQKQADALAIENAKLTAAEKSKNEKLALAQLIRDVGRQIMVYAAKKAAESGNIPAALGMLAAGVTANALINSYANKVTREAERDYMDAQAEFDRREAQIRGEGDNQAGSANQQRFGGSIKAENLSVEINPTVVIQGEQVFIGQGSVNEFGAELQALLLTSVNDAIENREIDLSNVSDRG